MAIEFTKYPLLLFMLYSIVILIVLRISSLLIKRYTREKLVLKWVRQNFSALELSIWLLFILWFLPGLYKQNLVYGITLSIITFIILLWLGWFLLREVVAGFILRNNPALKVGNQIEIEKKIYHIQRFNAQNVELKDDDGNMRFIPNSYFLHHKWTLIVDEELVFSKSILMQIKAIESKDKLLEDIKRFLINQPQYALKYSPQVQKISQGKDSMELKVVFYSLQSSHLHEMENLLRERFEG